MPLLLVRRCSAISGRNGSLAMSAARTRRWPPLSTLVTTTDARRASRSVLRALRSSNSMTDHNANGESRVANGEEEVILHYSLFATRYSPLFHLLDEHPDGAAAGQPDLPCRLVGDAEFQHFRFAVFDDVERLGDHGAFDTAAGDRAEEIALPINDQVRADRPWRRAPGLDHGRQSDLAAIFAPVLRGFEDIVVGCEHNGVLR